MAEPFAPAPLPTWVFDRGVGAERIVGYIFEPLTDALRAVTIFGEIITIGEEHVVLFDMEEALGLRANAASRPVEANP